MNEIHRLRSDALKGHSTFLGYCRTLVKNGHNPDAKLFVYKDEESMQNGIWDVHIKNIGKAAQLCVKESPSPHFAKYDQEGFARMRNKRAP